MNEKTICVTGGAGFIGSHLCKRLYDVGTDTVLCIDDLSTGDVKNLGSLVGSPRFVFCKADISDSQLLFSNVDLIYNLACPASPKKYQQNRMHTLRTNAIGTMRMLQFAGVFDATFLQASTSEVYGEPEVHPQHENYTGNVDCTGPRACYDEGKRFAESACFDANRQLGTKVRVVRIFNTYGPNMAIDDGRVVSNFIVQALQNKPLTVHGDGRQTRSLCYVDDTVDCLIRMANNQFGHIGPINVGNSYEISIIDLAMLVKEIINSRSSIEFYDRPVNDPTLRCPSITRARDLLGWEPRVELKDGLKRTIDYFDIELAKTWRNSRKKSNQ